jgi:hypothetical protein
VLGPGAAALRIEVDLRDGGIVDEAGAIIAPRGLRLLFGLFLNLLGILEEGRELGIVNLTFLG